MRPAYARTAVTIKRQTVFYASVNDYDFLTDVENRRYWCFEVVALNHNHDINIQQLWSQVYHMWNVDKEKHWLNDEEAERLKKNNVKYKTIDPLIEMLEDTFTKPEYYGDKAKSNTKRLSATEMCHEMGIVNPTKKDTNTVAAHLRLEGYHRRENDKKFSVVKCDDVDRLRLERKKRLNKQDVDVADLVEFDQN